LVEQRFRKSWVGGSIPLASLFCLPVSRGAEEV
jgi:hypothetical protein